VERERFEPPNDGSARVARRPRRPHPRLVVFGTDGDLYRTNC